LKKKLDQNALTPVIGNQVISLLSRDNERAGKIIRSLQSIFLEDNLINSSCKFNVVLESALSIVTPEAKKFGITISVENSPQLNPIISEVDLNQVLLNILNNAIRELSNAENLQKQIFIKSASALNITTISISDSGRGVNLNQQKELFELLSGEKTLGMGIGLWLCKHIVTRHDGNIWYEKSELGGAKFSISIPDNTN
jgi:signal transduction histidine kinase